MAGDALRVAEDGEVVWGGKSLAMLLDTAHSEPLIRARGRSQSPAAQQPPPPATSPLALEPPPPPSPATGYGGVLYGRGGSHDSDGRDEVAHALLTFGCGSVAQQQQQQRARSVPAYQSLDRDPYVSPGRGQGPPAPAPPAPKSPEEVPVLPMASNLSQAERRQRLERKRQEKEATPPPPRRASPKPPATTTRPPQPPPAPDAAGGGAVPLLAFRDAAPLPRLTTSAPSVPPAPAAPAPPAELSEPLSLYTGYSSQPPPQQVPSRSVSPARQPPRQDALPSASQQRDRLMLSPPDVRVAGAAAPVAPLFTPASDVPVFNSSGVHAVPHRPLRVSTARAPSGSETVIVIDDGARRSPSPPAPSHTLGRAPSNPRSETASPPSSPGRVVSVAVTPAAAAPAPVPGFLPSVKSPPPHLRRAHVQTPMPTSTSPPRVASAFAARPPPASVRAKAPPVRGGSPRSPGSDYGDVGRPVQDTLPRRRVVASIRDPMQPSGLYTLGQMPGGRGQDDFGRKGVIYPDADGPDSPLLLPNDGRFSSSRPRPAAGEMELAASPAPSPQNYTNELNPYGAVSHITVPCLSGAVYRLSLNEGEPYVHATSSHNPAVTVPVSDVQWNPEAQVLSLGTSDAIRILFSPDVTRTHIKKIRGFLDMSLDVSHNLHRFDLLGQPLAPPAPAPHAKDERRGRYPASPRRPSAALLRGDEADEYDSEAERAAAQAEEEAAAERHMMHLQQLVQATVAAELSPPQQRQQQQCSPVREDPDARDGDRLPMLPEEMARLTRSFGEDTRELAADRERRRGDRPRSRHDDRDRSRRDRGRGSRHDSRRDDRHPPRDRNDSQLDDRRHRGSRRSSAADAADDSRRSSRSDRSQKSQKSDDDKEGCKCVVM
eukprot:TRINITY_DN5278_c0_g1_i1.p1 TRINITY_DN5278_c0_g1~~TRINITY_DN5278_c0_g1_i1.p1  ORF type:complete len:902 (+),score=284.94 TRINITY_DN5278_c0_g1_i1:55-2706(+)